MKRNIYLILRLRAIWRWRVTHICVFALGSKVSLLLFLFNADINECVDNIHNCHNDAICNNTNGSFYCTCHDGYSGNGVNCSGTAIITNYLFSYLFILRLALFLLVILRLCAQLRVFFKVSKLHEPIEGNKIWAFWKTTRGKKFQIEREKSYGYSFKNHIPWKIY